MSTKALEEALHLIETNLDVGCPCHLHHGPLCPKRIAQEARIEHGKQPPERDDHGFAARTMHQNVGLRLAVAKAIAERAGHSMDCLDWENAKSAERECYLQDAEAALSAIDDYDMPGSRR